MAKYNAKRMLNELLEAEVPLNFQVDWTEEEAINYIIHMYDVFMFPPAWDLAEETAKIVCRLANFRNQKWVKAWKPGARA